MNTVLRPARLMLAIASIALVIPILLYSSPAAAQQELQYNGFLLPLPEGATASAARGIAERGWEPLTIVGTVDTPMQNASCWIRVSTVWSGHVLPGLVASGESWANAVDHVPAANGEWTLVVGAAMDATGAQRPMGWNHFTKEQWTGQALPTPAGGIGEALGLLVPDATSSRALVCGWTSEAPPTLATGETSVTHLRLPVLWNVDATGVDIIHPEFPAGLEGVVNDIASSGAGVFIAGGGGEGSGGVWRPQLWKSMDDGQTWSNEEIPLPLGVSSGEVQDCDHEVGHWLGAGYGQLTSGMTVPLLWELDTAGGTWIIHELPLPALDEGGQNGVILKLPGRTKYANIVLKRGLTSVTGVWLDTGSGWMLHEPEDYLLNPEIGTPIAPAGMDKYGRVAVKFPWPPTIGASEAGAQAGTRAGVLFPSPPTGIDDGRSTPQLIAVSASPNPFESGVRLVYTLPRDGWVTMTVHDVAGRVVRTLDRRSLRAGEERVVHWDGVAPDGHRAAAGVYFVRVETAYETSTVKIVRVE